jgi:hypothetical protein
VKVVVRQLDLFDDAAARGHVVAGHVRHPFVSQRSCPSA